MTIEQVLLMHRPSVNIKSYCTEVFGCSCENWKAEGDDEKSWHEWAEHVAEAIIIDLVKEIHSSETPVRGPCICKLNQEAVKCPQHGNQEANREPCPLCGAVLGYCAQGEYCTREDCRYVS